MKDDAPSLCPEILLTGGFHRPCQFEHEITSENGTRASRNAVVDGARSRLVLEDRWRNGWGFEAWERVRSGKDKRSVRNAKNGGNGDERRPGDGGINYCHSRLQSLDPDGWFRVVR